MEPIKPIDIKKNMKINDLVKQMSDAGFGAKKIARATEIFEMMVKDKDCKIFLGLAGAMVPAGMKKIIIDMINDGFVHVLVTTGANLTHDLVEALGHKHYKGNEYADDAELNKKGIVRMYDVYMEQNVYEDLEKFINSNYGTLSKCKNIREFLTELGRLAPEGSLINTCYKKNVPVFSPAISDSGIGLMIWNNIVNGKGTDVNTFDDLKEILDIVWTAKKTGFLYLGGGVPKNYIQQALQFGKEADYGIQITMDRVETGGSSGAPIQEGISWGKMKPEGTFVNVYCDTTIALPLIYASVKDRVKSTTQP